MKVVQLGFGAVGRENVRQLLARGHEVVAVVDKVADLGPESLAQACSGGAFAPLAARDIRACLEAVKADVILEATSFEPGEFLRVVRAAADHGCDLVSANGIVNISRMYPQTHTEANQIASAAGIRVVGAGVVPGFLSDLLPLLLTGACAEVNAIEVRRRSDFSKWGQDVMTRYGFGLAPAEFERQTREGRVVLFKNLWQSVHMLADELRWDIGGSEELKQPHVSARPRRGDHMRIDAGTVGGFIHSVETRCAGDRRIRIQVEGFVEPQGPAEEPALEIHLTGLPDISLTVGGGLLHGGGVMASTSATMVNILGSLHRVAPGLKSVADLSPIVCRA